MSNKERQKRERAKLKESRPGTTGQTEPLHIFLLSHSAGTAHSGHVLFVLYFLRWNYPTVSVSNRPSAWIVSFPSTFCLPHPLHVTTPFLDRYGSSG